MKAFRSIVLGVVVLAGIYFAPRAYAQDPPQQQEAKIVVVQDVTAMILIDSTGAIVRRIPVSGMKEYNEKIRSGNIPVTKPGEKLRAEANDPRIEFRDANGRIVNRISLKDVISTRLETRNVGGIEQTYSVRQGTGSNTIINRNGQFLLLEKYTRDVSDIEPWGRVAYFEGLTSLTRLTYFNVRGDVLFEYELPEGDSLAPLNYQFISDDGEVIVLGISWPEGNNPGVIVLNKNGLEIMQIKEENYYLPPEYLSPDGKYLSVLNGETTRIYNISTQQFWDSPKRIWVISITKVGLANVRDLITRQRTVIDLRELIKE